MSKPVTNLERKRRRGLRHKRGVALGSQPRNYTQIVSVPTLSPWSMTGAGETYPSFRTMLMRQKNLKNAEVIDWMEDNHLPRVLQSR